MKPKNRTVNDAIWNQFGASIDKLIHVMSVYLDLEILIYNMRHTQHHAAQLNLFMRMDLEKHMEWSFRAGDIGLEW